MQPSQPRAGALAQAGTTTNAKVVSAALPSPSLPAIRSPAAPPSSPTPVGSSWFIVGNTEGQGVYVRRTTRLEDKLGAAYPDGARFQEIGPTAVGDGRTWRHVRADDGREGFVPSEYLIVAGPVASPPPGAEREPTSSASDPLKAATDRIGREGYVVRDVQSYDPNALLRVLVGIRRGSDGYDQRAFFFLRERYLGADTWYPSGQISVEKHESTRVILRYALYRPTDANCCASAGSVTVRYNWNGDKLEPLDEIPSADLKATVSRR